MSATVNGKYVELGINGNVTTQEMIYRPTTSDQNKETSFSFKITGPSGTIGFANMTIPKNAVANGSIPVVYIDNGQASDQGYAQDSDNYYVWFTTHFSTHQLRVQFGLRPTSQGWLGGLEYALIIPVAATILVPTVIAVKRSKRRTSNRERQGKDSPSRPNETENSNNPGLGLKQNANAPQQKKQAISCDYHLGYLSDLPKNIQIPNECYTCAKLIECKRKT